MSLIVRKANIHDAENMVTLLTESQWFTYAELYSKEYIEEMIEQYYSLERIKKEIISTSNDWHGYYVAATDNQIVGVIGGGIVHQTLAEIYVFYVKPSMLGNGIGSRLLTFYSKIQKFKHGAKTQQVLVAKGNMHGITFYEAKGFTFVSEQATYGSQAGDNDVSLKYIRNL